MNKFLISTIAILLPITVGATKINLPTDPIFNPNIIPANFSSTAETSVMEWGCPVSEVVDASSGADAIQQITKECLEQVTKAANDKPNVFEVIKAEVIWPDISVSEVTGGFHLQGTFFLETLVLQGSMGEKK